MFPGPGCPDAHALLEPLVQKHVEMHGNDAEKSLASVSSIGSVREQLQQIADQLREDIVRRDAAAFDDEDQWWPLIVE